MAQSEPHVFTNVTPEKYARLVEKARGAGIDLDGSSGVASKFGVEIAWRYSPEARELTLQCLNTPFFINPEDVDAKIRSLVSETMG